ncbi:tetratricopeptide repeat protein [Flavobacterium dauae]|uniref:tetratricopeptide repeat protein n=1 Tax=Flavobacterium dauae TaxID=1563479 RepID=UPI00101B3E2C|nr:tetratricopeptide repeat protein [Flavobacterium dauae]WLD22990.1 tetratricopeptide repeat protein [Flavobacterium dauae]
MKKVILLLLIIFSQLSFGQENFLEKGNTLMQQGKHEEAQEIFENALKEDPQNLLYKNQIALALINQRKNDEAEIIIQEVLKIDSLNVASLWYGGINNFMAENGSFKKAVNYFEKAYDLIDKNSSQFFAVNYFIGKSYRNLLYSEGINYEETNRMLETYKKYMELQPNADDVQEIINFIKYIEEKRPPKNVQKWILTNSTKAEQLIKKQLDELQ